MVTSSFASKHFGDLRKKAKIAPLFITENGAVDTVVISYKDFEKIYQRIFELEESEILEKRIKRLEKDPGLAVSWMSVRRSGQMEK